MPTRFLRVLSAVAAIVLSTAAFQTAAPPAQAANRLQAIDKAFAAWTNRTPGCAVGVGENGQSVLEKANVLNFTPGTRWSYSNSGFNLAAISPPSQELMPVMKWRRQWWWRCEAMAWSSSAVQTQSFRCARIHETASKQAQDLGL